MLRRFSAAGATGRWERPGGGVKQAKAKRDSAPDHTSAADKKSKSHFVFSTCKPTFEKLLKWEIQQAHPELKFAFSRPGLLTWKAEHENFALKRGGLVFLRAAGHSIVAQARDAADVRTEARLLRDTMASSSGGVGRLRLHVFGRESERGPAGDKEHPLAVADREARISALRRELLRGSGVAADAGAAAADDDADVADGGGSDGALFHPEEQAREGELVLDVCVGSSAEEALFLGWHVHNGGERRTAFANDSLPFLRQPKEAPSRAYLKVEEAIHCLRLAPDAAAETAAAAAAAAAAAGAAAAPQAVPAESGGRESGSARRRRKRESVLMAPGDTALEIGSAPGGCVYSLLQRGLLVTGVDPCPSHARTAHHDVITQGRLGRNFTEVRARLHQLLPAEAGKEAKGVVGAKGAQGAKDERGGGGSSHHPHRGRKEAGTGNTNRGKVLARQQRKKGLPASVQWLLCDANMHPSEAVPHLVRLCKHYAAAADDTANTSEAHAAAGAGAGGAGGAVAGGGAGGAGGGGRGLKGLLYTCKLESTVLERPPREVLQYVHGVRDSLRKTGLFREVTVAMLPSNRQEVLVYGRR
jgi:hypothetical protein